MRLRFTHVGRSLLFSGAAVLWFASLSACIVVLAVKHRRQSVRDVELLRRSGYGNMPEPGIDDGSQWTWDRNNIIAVCLSVLVSLTSGPGGNGGGTFLVPLFNLLLGFSIKEAAAITACVMAFGALTSTLWAVMERHPNHPDRSMIDYRTVMIISPPMLFGISVGVFGNEVLPTWLVTYLMILVFSYGTYKVARSYSSLVYKELQHSQPGAAGVASDTTPLLSLAAKQLSCNKMDTSVAMQVPLKDTHQHDAIGTPLGSAGSSASNAKVGGEQGLARPLSPQAASGGGASSCGRERSTFLSLSRAALGVDSPRTRGAPPPDTVRSVTSGSQEEDGCVVVVSGGTQEGVWPRGPLPAVYLLHSGKRRAESCWTRTPKRAAGLLMLYVSAFIGLDALRSMQAKCSGQYWGLLAAEGTTAVLLTLVTGLPLWRAGRRRDTVLANAALDAKQAALLLPRAGMAECADGLLRRGSLTSAEDAVQWTTARLCYMPIGMFMAGIFAGLLGLGGGFITMPLLLTLGLHPQVTAASSKLILLISTANTTASYIIADRLNLTYAMPFGVINLCVCPVGILLMNRLIAATGRPSHLVLLTLVRYGLGTVILISIAGVKRTEELFQGIVEGFDWAAACS